MFDIACSNLDAVENDGACDYSESFGDLLRDCNEVLITLEVEMVENSYLSIILESLTSASLK